jgi:hypothetical protein
MLRARRSAFANSRWAQTVVLRLIICPRDRLEPQRPVPVRVFAFSAQAAAENLGRANPMIRTAGVLDLWNLPAVRRRVTTNQP